MKKILMIAGLLLLSMPAFGQGTLTVTLDYTVMSPWQTPCSVTIVNNCVQGWRIIATTGGTRATLFDIPAPTTGFTGTITATGSGSVNTPTGTVVGQTIGLNSTGAELLSPDSETAVFGQAPPAPKITVTIVLQ